MPDIYFIYDEGAGNILRSITVAAVPNGMLQARYNPTAQDTIWIAGRNAPTLGEEFRVRLSFHRLKEKAKGVFNVFQWRQRNFHGSNDSSSLVCRHLLTITLQAWQSYD